MSVCMHVRNYQATTASLVVDLRVDTPSRAWACLGSPCASVYVPFFPPDVPVVLRDPAEWHRFAALRERVETEPDGLEAVRSALGPIERELWDAADAALSRRLLPFACLMCDWTTPDSMTRLILLDTPAPSGQCS